MIDLLVQGLPEMRASLEILQKQAPKAQIRALSLGAEALANSWKDWSSGPRGPRRIGRKSGFHVLSIRARPQRGGMRQVVSTKAGYVIYHEIHPQRPRPHMAPALKETAPVLQKLFEGKTKQAMTIAAKAADRHAQSARSILLGKEVNARARSF